MSDGGSNPKRSGEDRSNTTSVNGAGGHLPSADALSRSRPTSPTPAPAKSGAERRGHMRVAWQIETPEPLLLEVEEPRQAWREVQFTLVDLGAGGVGILVEEPLDPGSRLRVTFPLPSRLGRDPEAGEPETVAFAPWSALAEIVHGNAAKATEYPHVPPQAHRPYHRGARFSNLQGEAELRLLRALYGPLPDGWGVEQYRIRDSGAGGERRTKTEKGEREGTLPRYAVLRHGRRVAWGFASYDRARTRALSMYLDERAETRKAQADDHA
jgi:hypothetical protein